MRAVGAGSWRRPEREPKYLEVLVRIGEVLSSSLDWQRTSTGVCEVAVETLADICVLALCDPELRVVAAAHRDPKLTPEVQSIGKFLRGSSPAADPLAAVAESGNPLLVPVVDDEYVRLHSTNREHEAFMRRMGYRSLIAVPVVSPTQGVVGALQFVCTDPKSEPYDEASLRFAQDVARHCANALEKSRLYEQTLRIATVYQKAALPDHLPQHEGIAFDAIYEPSSQELLVGGDWYDAFDLPDGKIAITVGDVLGHGLDAAIWMSRLRNGLRAALFAEADPIRALEIGGKLLRAEFRDEFVTAMVGIVDPRSQTLVCASAGHPGPLVWEEGESVVEVEDRGVPLGLRELGPIAATQTFTLRPGTFIVFFTDGLLEWNRNIGEAWRNLHRAVRTPAVRESPHPARAIRDAVIRSEHHGDDVAVLTVSWRAKGHGYEVPTLSGSTPSGNNINPTPTASATTQPSNDAE